MLQRSNLDLPNSFKYLSTLRFVPLHTRRNQGLWVYASSQKTGGRHFPILRRFSLPNNTTSHVAPQYSDVVLSAPYLKHHTYETTLLCVGLWASVCNYWVGCTPRAILFNNDRLFCSSCPLCVHCFIYSFCSGLTAPLSVQTTNIDRSYLPLAGDLSFCFIAVNFQKCTFCIAFPICLYDQLISSLPSDYHRLSHSLHRCTFHASVLVLRPDRFQANLRSYFKPWSVRIIQEISLYSINWFSFATKHYPNRLQLCSKILAFSAALCGQITHGYFQFSQTVSQFINRSLMWRWRSEFSGVPSSTARIRARPRPICCCTNICFEPELFSLYFAALYSSFVVTRSKFIFLLSFNSEAHSCRSVTDKGKRATLFSKNIIECVLDPLGVVQGTIVSWF